MTLSRLGRPHVETMVEQVTRGKTLPAEVLQQIVSKTDGVPLFVEELTKSVVESVGATGRSPLQALDIPATLQDSLMARLDRLGAAKEIAQLGATIGREFTCELLQAVSPLDGERIQYRLTQLVDAELLYQRGVLPHATYLFKHALIQDTAYQSLLKSKRQQYHQQIAQVLEEQFPDTTETQPELLARHYTDAGLVGQAVPYWQRAGQRALQRSANVEAIGHLTKGLELLQPLPTTPERAQHELTFHITIGAALVVTRGYAAPEVEQAYTRARELCQQLGETSQLFPVLWGLWNFYLGRELRTARELAEQLLSLAQRVQDPVLLLEAHDALRQTFSCLGELAIDSGSALRIRRQAMSAEDNKATLLRVIDDLNNGNLDFIDDVFSPNFAFYSPTSPNWPRGLEGARKMITQLRTILADVHATVEDILAEGDKVAVRWTFRGTYQGDVRPGAPTPGEPCVAVAIAMYRFVDGKIADDWGVTAFWQTGEVWNKTPD